MLNTKVVSLSFALTVVLLYLLCALFVYLSPIGFLAFINTWAHGIDLTGIAASRPFTAADFLIGLVSIFIASFLTGAVFSVIYNRLSGETKA
ncbi:MAG: hypothetical protein HZB85_03795 [Deltaproteobacteria bacterium]|nr:hypothetical protein [Deltaproteobacteria bacterium]